MRNIEVAILNPEVIAEAERMAACAARLTQHGERINSLNDFLDLYDKPYTKDMIENLCKLPHPTLQKFGVINVAVVGASRRFLAQVTRHQNEVKFMSASLHYSDYTAESDFCIPYELEDNESARAAYTVEADMARHTYERMIEHGADPNTAGYMMPQGMRNVLIISATPYQWKHMIRQRVCRRSATEIRYVMLLIWDQLMRRSPALFKDAGPFCTSGLCLEGKMSCKNCMEKNITPAAILKQDFPRYFNNNSLFSTAKGLDTAKREAPYED